MSACWNEMNNSGYELFWRLSQWEHFVPVNGEKYYTFTTLYRSVSRSTRKEAFACVIMVYFIRSYSFNWVAAIIHYFTNMTSLLGFLQEYHPRDRIVARGHSPRATILSRGSYPWWKPHRNVITVLLYRTRYKTEKGEKLKTSEIFDKY